MKSPWVITKRSWVIWTVTLSPWGIGTVRLTRSGLLTWSTCRVIRFIKVSRWEWSGGGGPNCGGLSEPVRVKWWCWPKLWTFRHQLRYPVLRTGSLERLPLTGWLILAVQTTVRFCRRSEGEGSENQMVKQYDLLPTWWKPAVKAPSGEIRTSSGFSMEREEILIIVSEVEDEGGELMAREK